MPSALPTLFASCVYLPPKMLNGARGLLACTTVYPPLAAKMVMLSAACKLVIVFSHTAQEAMPVANISTNLCSVDGSQPAHCQQQAPQI